MKESTIHIKGEFTFIRRHDNDFSFDLDKAYIADALKHATGADNVLVTDAKVFESEEMKK